MTAPLRCKDSFYFHVSVSFPQLLYQLSEYALKQIIELGFGDDSDWSEIERESQVIKGLLPLVNTKVASLWFIRRDIINFGTGNIY